MSSKPIIRPHFKSKHQWSSAMSRPTSQHCITLLVRGLLVLLCTLAIPGLASSESDVASDHLDVFKRYKLLGLDDVDRPRRRIVSRVAPESDGCPVARVDIALERGLLSYSILLPELSEGEAGQSAKHGGAYGTTMLIGEKDCIIRIRIEHAKDLMVYDSDLGKSLRDRIKQKRGAQ
jgi:hypothetical protein